MSMFKRPKKPMQPRIFSSYDDENNDACVVDSGTKMEVDAEIAQAATSRKSSKLTKADKKRDIDAVSAEKQPKKPSLLSFDDEEEGDEVFQVRKSSHSKKVMKKLDKERRKKKHSSDPTLPSSASYGRRTQSPTPPPPPSFSTRDDNVGDAIVTDDDVNDVNPISVKRSHVNSNSIQTEIRTDDFVLVLKKSEQPLQVLNGRAALCAGRDDMSDDEDDDGGGDNGNDRSMQGGSRKQRVTQSQQHRFAKPDNFKTVLESGAIPDAAMIHAARKRRQKAREDGEFVPLEDKPPATASNPATVSTATAPSAAKGGSKSRLVREDGDDDDGSDEERVDMSAINGAREREERREKFYSVQQEYSGEDSDPEMTEWENQQIRKGVTGAQLVSAQQESIYGQFMINSSANDSSKSSKNDRRYALLSDNDDARPTSSATASTGEQLEQAYARSATTMEQAHRLLSTTKRSAPTSTTTATATAGDKNGAAAAVGPRLPSEVQQKLLDRLQRVRELHEQHVDEIEQIGSRLEALRIQQEENVVDAPVAAVKYRFYQELRGYVTDLIECLDEKLPAIVELERKALGVMAKQATLLIERRRQDVIDQAEKEMAEASKPGAAARKMLDDEERVRRATDREGRRTRRRQVRERIDINNTHMDGMSSDDEIHEDNGIHSFKSQLEQLEVERNAIFDDVNDDYSQIGCILNKFEDWRRNDYSAYTDTYFSICLPKILGPLIRLHLVTWNPLHEQCDDLERMEWYASILKYGWSAGETEDSLANDPDVRLMPVLIEKIVLPKITEIVETCWDPMSSTQTLRLVVALGRFGREYPALKPSSKYLRSLFNGIVDKLKDSLKHDVFIPIFPKQLQEARSSFFQRQFSSALKLLRNILSWQGILADEALKSMAITTLLNRNLMMAMRVCSAIDAVAKASIIVNTLPRVWLHPQTGHLDSLQMLLQYLNCVSAQLDARSPLMKDTTDKLQQVLHSLHADRTH